MKKLLSLFTLSLCFLFIAMSANAQTAIITEGFEGAVSPAAPAGWTFVNPAANFWATGNSTSFIGSNSAYITNTAGANPPIGYLNSSTAVSHMYTDFTVPAGEGCVVLQFDFKCVGEVGFDFLKVYIAPTTFTPVAGTTPSGTGVVQVGCEKYNSQRGYVHISIILPASLAGTTERLVFSWTDDSSSGDNPASIDNVSLTSRPTSNPAALSGTKTIGGASPTYTTIRQALDSLNANGVGTGGVTFNIRPGTYGTDAGIEIDSVITISSVYNASSSNFIKFVKESGTVTVERVGNVYANTSFASSYDYLVGIWGADFFTFDGIDVRQKGAATTADIGYFVKNLTTVDGATNNTIQNTSITMNRANVITTTNMGSYAILSCAATTVAIGGGSTPASSAGANSNNKYYNLIVSNSYVGINIQGNATFPDVGTEIGNTTPTNFNTIGSATANDIGNGSSASYGIQVNNQSGVKIYNNEVQNVTVTSTVAVDGIVSLLGQGTCEVYRNKVHDIKNSSVTATTGMTGMRVSHATTGTNVIKVYNNFVYAITSGYTGAASATRQVKGIFASGTSGTVAQEYDIDFNSVRMDNSAAPTISNTCFEIATTSGPVIKVRNNIFSNFTGVQAGIAKHYCWVTTSATLTGNTGSVSNNNDLYVATATNGFTGLTNATDRITLADWRTAVSQDASSIAQDPSFTSATNLHIPFAAVGSLESGGLTGTGITTDIDNQTRPGPPGSVNGGGTVADIGADEFDGVPTDLSGPSISYTTLTNTNSTANRSFTPVTVTDPSGVNGTLGTRPRVYYKKSTSPNTLAGWQFVEASGATSPFSFTIDNTLIGGVSVGDVIQYFVVAQDLAPTPNVGINSGSFAAQPTSVALTAAAFPIGGSINLYNIVAAPLAGDYTIGIFAFNRFTGKNLTFEKVVKKVMRDVYEVSNTKVNKSDAKATNTSLYPDNYKLVRKEVEEITWVPMVNGVEYDGPLYEKREDNQSLSPDAGVGVYPTITAAVNDLNLRGISAPVRFLLKDPNYSSGETFPIIINTITGSSSTNTLTLQPDSAASTVTGSSALALLKLNGADWVTIDGLNTGGKSLTFNNTNAGGTNLWNASASITDGATNNNYKNLILKGVSISGILSGSGTTLGSDAEVANSDNSVQNCTFTQTQNAMYLRGGTTSLDQNWNVTGNTCGSATFADYLTFRGIAMINSQNFTVANNSIIGISTATTSTSIGVALFITINGGSISKNQISNIHNTNTGGYGAIGIYLGASSLASNVTVSNNFVYNVTGNGYSFGAGSADNGYGIFVESGAGYNIYYNSVSMNTNQGVDGLPAAFNVASGVSTAGALNVRNNAFSNTQTVGVNRYSVYCGATNAVFADINYNDYYFGTAPNLGFLGSNQANLGLWKIATGKDANSISSDPKFTSLTNLHIDVTAGSLLDAAATPIAGITTDIDNALRNVTTPDIGADEFTPTTFANDVGVLNNIAPTWIGGGNSTDVVIIGSGTIAPKATIKNFGTANQLTPFNVTYKITGAKTYTSIKPDTVSVGQQNVLRFDSTFVPDTAGVCNVTIYTQLGSDGNRVNDTLKTTFTIVNNPNYGTISGYSFANSTTAGSGAPSQPTFCWKDTTGSTGLANSTVNEQPGIFTGSLDDGYWKVALPAGKKIRFFGVDYDTVRIGTNGIIAFTEFNPAGGNWNPPVGGIPSVNVPNALYPFWWDQTWSAINPSTPSNRLSYKFDNNQLIVTFDNAPRYLTSTTSPAGDYLSYQAVIDISLAPSSNSRLYVQYDAAATGSVFLSNYTAGTNQTHCIGIQDVTGTLAVQYRYSTGSVVTGGPVFESPLASAGVQFGPDNTKLNYNCPKLQAGNITLRLEKIQLTRKDTVTVDIRSSTLPYPVIESKKAVYDSLTGVASPQFTLLEDGAFYYIVVKHRQSISTWSAAPVQVTGNSISYDFTTALTQAFSSNMVLVGGKASFFTGDLCTVSTDSTQNGIVQLQDIIRVFNSSASFQAGQYIQSDVNFDKVVNLTDILAVFNNSSSFVVYKAPPGAVAPPMNFNYTLESPVFNYQADIQAPDKISKEEYNRLHEQK